MSEKQTEFINGFYPKQKHQNAPDFVHSAGSFNVEKALEFFNKKKAEGQEWVNYQILHKKDDRTKIYATVDNWKPENPSNLNETLPIEKIQLPPEQQQQDVSADVREMYPEEDINPEDIKF